MRDLPPINVPALELLFQPNESEAIKAAEEAVEFADTRNKRAMQKMLEEIRGTAKK